ncbi:hypothetical protein BP00DRAFT_135857 [Aspergillus indologenus CBS 114.80]|uniref:Uncharacterized protein n=1 Tax=Aspergillus indologenus CBS 114.80 TaxID=1450541 RepID=A0A2V5IAE9_9EURO|nr:hypothetical protein BP00DRAFT_135857 [Aspergillus indologenus CBS 114.80]
MMPSHFTPDATDPLLLPELSNRACRFPSLADAAHTLGYEYVRGKMGRVGIQQGNQPIVNRVDKKKLSAKNFLFVLPVEGRTPGALTAPRFCACMHMTMMLLSHSSELSEPFGGPSRGRKGSPSHPHPIVTTSAASSSEGKSDCA